MKRPPPSRLYKYHSIAGRRLEWLRQIVLESELYFASPLAFNDPFEARFDISMEGSVSDYRAFAEEARHRGHLQLPANMGMTDYFLTALASDFASLALSFPEHFRESAGRDIGVPCLTEVNDDVLMWGHYADGHRGVCLDFTPANAPQFFEDAYDITYSPHYPQLNWFRMGDEERARAAFLTKSSLWQYEREWRLVDLHSGAGLRRFPPDALTAIVLGCEMGPDAESRIRGWVRERSGSLAVRRATRGAHEYTITVVDA